MPAYRKASIRQLTASAYELDGRVFQGTLRKTENGWMVGSMSLEQFLEQNQDHEVAVILFDMDESADRPLDTRVCHTCGREYTGITCPYCREVLFRLRGR